MSSKYSAPVASDWHPWTPILGFIGAVGWVVLALPMLAIERLAGVR